MYRVSKTKIASYQEMILRNKYILTGWIHKNKDDEFDCCEISIKRYGCEEVLYTIDEVLILPFIQRYRRIPQCTYTECESYTLFKFYIKEECMLEVLLENNLPIVDDVEHPMINLVSFTYFLPFHKPGKEFKEIAKCLQDFTDSLRKVF